LRFPVDHQNAPAHHAEVEVGECGASELNGAGGIIDIAAETGRQLAAFFGVASSHHQEFPRLDHQTGHRIEERTPPRLGAG
jgi:hypothetical protein